MLAIYKREFKSYFYSMTGSIFIAFLTFMTGIYFMAYNLHSGYPYFWWRFRCSRCGVFPRSVEAGRISSF